MQSLTPKEFSINQNQNRFLTQNEVKLSPFIPPPSIQRIRTPSLVLGQRSHCNFWTKIVIIAIFSEKKISFEFNKQLI